MADDEPKNKSKQLNYVSLGIGASLGLGIGIGAAMNNLVAGIVIGLALSIGVVITFGADHDGETGRAHDPDEPDPPAGG